MADKFIARRITIRENQASWLDKHPEISLSGLTQKAIDSFNIRFNEDQEIKSLRMCLDQENSPMLEELLRCPICRFEYQRFSDPELISGEDNYKAWHGRGDLIKIPFFGECGHNWNICIGHHKGQSFAFIEEGNHDKNPMNKEEKGAE